MIDKLDINNMTKKFDISENENNNELLIRNIESIEYITFQWCLKIYDKNFTYRKKEQHD